MVILVRNSTWQHSWHSKDSTPYIGLSNAQTVPGALLSRQYRCSSSASNGAIFRSPLNYLGRRAVADWLSFTSFADESVLPGQHPTDSTYAATGPS